MQRARRPVQCNPTLMPRRRCVRDMQIPLSGPWQPDGLRMPRMHWSQTFSRRCNLCLLRRFYLEVVGRRRFSLARAWEQDGYRVAQPAYFGDDPVPAGTPAAAELRALAAAVEATADEWVDRVKCARPAPALCSVLMQRVMRGVAVQCGKVHGHAWQSTERGAFVHGLKTVCVNAQFTVVLVSHSRGRSLCSRIAAHIAEIHLAAQQHIRRGR